MKTAMSNNPLAARFASHTPMLIGAEKSDWLTQAMPKLSAEMSRIEEMTASKPIEYMAHDDFWPSAENWMSQFRPYKVSGGTLSIPVKGMLLNNFGFSLFDWATGYEYIVKAFERGMSDPEVQRIAMVVDSPGGEVAGCFDAVDRVFSMRGQKPIQAFVNESAYSAAYAWASVADKITMTRTAGVGSVGVVTSHMDASGAMEKMGYKITFMYSGSHKVDGNPYEGLSPAVQARIQKRIESMYNIFVSTTARNLGVPETVVRATEALTYGAEEAIDIGFAHEVKPFEEAMVAFSNTDLNGEVDMPKPNEPQQAPAAATFTQTDIDAARAEGMSEGVKAEQARIGGILACDAAANRPTMSLHLALKTQQTVDEASALLAVSPEEKKPEAAAPASTGANFAAAMGEDNPNLGAGADGNLEPNSAEATLAEFRAVNNYGSNK